MSDVIIQWHSCDDAAQFTNGILISCDENCAQYESDSRHSKVATSFVLTFKREMSGKRRDCFPTLFHFKSSEPCLLSKAELLR